MKITRRQIRAIIAEAYRDDREAFYDSGEHEEQQDLARKEAEFQMMTQSGMDPEDAYGRISDDDLYTDEIDYERDQAFEHVPQAVESFLQKYPDLTYIRGMVEHSLSTGDPDDENEQMMKIGARLALMAKRYPEMAEAMLEELQDQ
ncbi:hypothetical protein KY315_00960 [Candidatus Woesearchaeota archaeon]|nr:hypothetical protein [Candidatus Woesearchaeota archaeon]